MINTVAALNSSPRRVAHLTSSHPASDARIFQKECLSLARQGYHVDLVVPGEANGSREGVQIQFVSAARGRVLRSTLTGWKVFRKALRLSADLYHVHDPDLLPWALLLRSLGKTVIYDAHEHLADDIMTKDYIPKGVRPLVSKVIGNLELALAGRMTAIIAATPAIARRFEKYNPCIVQNYPLQFGCAAPCPPYHLRSLTIAYVGGITVIRGLHEMLAAMDHLPLEVKLLMPTRFDPPDLERFTRPYGDRILLPGWQPPAALREMLTRTRVGLALFHHLPNHTESQPHKLFEYMAAGLPVVVSNLPRWREFVEGYQCGIVVDPHRADQTAAAIRWLLENPDEAEAMGNRGREAVIKSLNWPNEASKLFRLYKSLLPPQS